MSLLCARGERFRSEIIYIFIYIHVEAQNPIIKRYNGVGGELHSHHPSQESGEMVLWGGEDLFYVLFQQHLFQ